jgi:hypothetical protein
MMTGPDKPMRLLVPEDFFAGKGLATAGLPEAGRLSPMEAAREESRNFLLLYILQNVIHDAEDKRIGLNG